MISEEKEHKWKTDREINYDRDVNASKRQAPFWPLNKTESDREGKKITITRLL